jgi:ribonuclease P protein component
LSAASPLVALREGLVALITLKRRADFLRIRGGARWATPAFVLETRPEPDRVAAGEEPRFGFTVTKKLGKAVLRNRIRRRLKALVASLSETSANRGYDYVLIARAVAAERSFGELKKELEQAFHRVHEAAGPRRRGPAP